MLCRNNLSCDGQVEFPLEEKVRLVEMLVYVVIFSLFRISNFIKNVIECG